MDEQDSLILTSIQKTLSENPNANQRTLAENSNVSLGMMNAVLKRCISRGWIAVKNLNMKKVCYCLTPEGFEAISKRSTNYLKRSFSMMNDYADRICSQFEKYKSEGVGTIVLLGKSNIQFVLEYAANKCNINFIVDENAENLSQISDNVVYIAGEMFSQNISEIKNKIRFINLIDMIDF